MSTTGSRNTRNRPRVAQRTETGDSHIQSTRSQESTQDLVSEPDPSPAPEPGSVREVQTDPSLANLAHYEEPQATIAQQLQELREWRQRALEEQELRHLQEIKRRFDQGDTSALIEEVSQPTRVLETPHEPNAGAPRPEKPTQFTNKDRAQYNRWERECEATFRGSPKTFQTESIKIDFGVRYITDPLRSSWDAYVHDERRKSSSWEPSWSNLKTVMVDSLGPPEQRKLVAHRALKHVKQEWSQDPNDLLAQLDTLWTELGDSYSEEQRIMDFIGALTMTIQKELLLLEPAQRRTLTDVNSRARLIWDRTRRDKPNTPKLGGNRSNQANSHPNRERGREKTWKRSRRTPAEQRQGMTTNRVQSHDWKANRVCYKCQKLGHHAKECKEGEVSNSEPSEQKSGKGRGRRA